MPPSPTSPPAAPAGSVIDDAAPAPAGSVEPDDAALDAALDALLARGTPDAYAHVEHRLLRAAYTLCGQNQVRTARLLGISRNVLRAQLLRFGYLTRIGSRRATRPAQDGAPEAARRRTRHGAPVPADETDPGLLRGVPALRSVQTPTQAPTQTPTPQAPTPVPTRQAAADA